MAKVLEALGLKPVDDTPKRSEAEEPAVSRRGGGGADLSVDPHHLSGHLPLSREIAPGRFAACRRLG